MVSLEDAGPPTSAFGSATKYTLPRNPGPPAPSQTPPQQPQPITESDLPPIKLRPRDFTFIISTVSGNTTNQNRFIPLFVRHLQALSEHDGIETAFQKTQHSRRPEQMGTGTDSPSHADNQEETCSSAYIQIPRKTNAETS